MKFIEVLGGIYKDGLMEYHEFRNLGSAKSFCVDVNETHEGAFWVEVWIVNEDTGCNGEPLIFAISENKSHAEYIKNALLEDINNPECCLLRPVD